MPNLATASDPYFACYYNCAIQAWDGRWDLYYFKSEEIAKQFLAEYPDGRLTQTTGGKYPIWRVSLRYVPSGRSYFAE